MQTVIFIGSSRDDIRKFPEAARREMGRQILRIQHGLDPGNWKPMKTGRRRPAPAISRLGNDGSSKLEIDMGEKMTVSGGNVFEDLGFAPDEAAAMLTRETLLIALEKELRKRGKKQRELAAELGIPRTRISEVMNLKTDRFSADKLVGLLHRAGKHVEIRVR